VDAERLQLGGQGLHPAVDGELRGGIGAGVRRSGQAGHRGDGDDVSRALTAHDRQHRAGDAHGTEHAHRELALDLLGRELLEQARLEARGVVDQHVHGAEAVDSGGDGGLGVLRAGHVELDDEQPLCVAERLTDGVGVAAGGHDVVAGGECGLGELGAHAAAGAGDDPGLLLGGHDDQQSAHLEKVGAPVEGGTGGVPQTERAGSRLASWTRRRRSTSSSPPAAPGSRPSRQG
jgi:hypothetical protein